MRSKHFPSYMILTLSWCLKNRIGSRWKKLIKQGVQELWRSYSNNNVIVFHADQSEKHHKKFPEKRQEMNSKRKIQMASVILDILKKVILFKNNLIRPFQLLVSRLCSFLYLIYSKGQHNPTYELLLRDVFFSNILPNRIFQIYPTRIKLFVSRVMGKRKSINLLYRSVL